MSCSMIVMLFSVIPLCALGCSCTQMDFLAGFSIWVLFMPVVMYVLLMVPSLLVVFLPRILPVNMTGSVLWNKPLVRVRFMHASTCWRGSMGMGMVFLDWLSSLVGVGLEWR